MDGIITSVSVVTIQDSFYWSAHAVINGRLTTASCGHNHKRPDLAEKCLRDIADRWVAIADSDHSVSLVPDLIVGAPIYEVSWSEMTYGKVRDVRTRFCFLDQTLPHPSNKVIQ